MHAGGSENAPERISGSVGFKTAAGALQTHIGTGTAMVDRTILNAVHSGDQRGSGRQAGGIGHIIVTKAGSLSGNSVDVRTGVAVRTLTAQMIRAQGVEI